MGDFVPQPTELWGILPTAFRAMWIFAPPLIAMGDFARSPQSYGDFARSPQSYGGFRAPPLHYQSMDLFLQTHLQNAILHVIDWHTLLDALLNAI